MVLMGLVKLPSISIRMRSTTIPQSQTEYQEIASLKVASHRYLHFANNGTLSPPGTSGYDKLGKIREVMEVITKNSFATFELGRDVSVDEAMVQFKGRLTLKQYMPQKPLKRGIKVWMLSDVKTGLCEQFRCIYRKKEKDREKTRRFDCQITD